MPFRKWHKTFDFTCSFNDGFWTATKNACKFLRIRSSFGTGIRISHANKWPVLLNKCLVGSVSFYWVVMFTPTFFHISFCLSNIFFSTWAFTSVYHTRRMWVFAFDFKQWFYLSCYPFYCNSLTLIGKCLESLNKMFGSIFVFFTISYFNQYKWLLSLKRSGGIINESLFWEVKNWRMTLFKNFGG